MKFKEKSQLKIIEEILKKKYKRPIENFTQQQWEIINDEIWLGTLIPNESFIEKYCEKINWYSLGSVIDFSGEFIEKHKDELKTPIDRNPYRLHNTSDKNTKIRLLTLSKSNSIRYLKFKVKNNQIKPELYLKNLLFLNSDINHNFHRIYIDDDCLIIPH